MDGGRSGRRRAIFDFAGDWLELFFDPSVVSFIASPLARRRKGLGVSATLLSIPLDTSCNGATNHHHLAFAYNTRR